MGIITIDNLMINIGTIKLKNINQDRILVNKKRFKLKIIITTTNKKFYLHKYFKTLPYKTRLSNKNYH